MRNDEEQKLDQDCFDCDTKKRVFCTTLSFNDQSQRTNSFFTS